ncbi:et translation product-related [Anaeramoeba flamelloides]|uniref:UNC93-like protein MFSD11 n=1 Tax=Anaeramoeba flamelloides TaxID=1746091 RepID=A0AAV7Z973_9EUKA|nr:et translation product-related [Anaeramoeba flamelloides]
MELKDHCKITLKRMFLLFFGFTLLFGGVESPESLITTVLGSNGYIAFGFLYGGFSFNILFIAPYVVKRLGASRSVIFGSILIIFVPASLIEIKFWVVYCMMFIGGNGVGIWYASSNTYILRVSDENSVGTIGGIFTTFLIFGTLMGNLLLTLLYYYNIQDRYVFLTFTTRKQKETDQTQKIDVNSEYELDEFEDLGELTSSDDLDDSISSYFDDQSENVWINRNNLVLDNFNDYRVYKNYLQNKVFLNESFANNLDKLESKIQFQDETPTKMQIQKKSKSPTSFQNIKLTLSFLTKGTVLLLMTITVLEGLSMGMISGFLPTLMEKKNIPICSMVFCFSKSVSSIVLGKISDTFGNLFMFLSSMLFGVIGSLILIFTPTVSNTTFIVCYALLGMSIGGYSVIVFPLTMIFYPDNQVDCIALFKFTRGATIGLSMTYISHLTRQSNFHLIISFQLICLISILYLHLRIKSINNLVKPEFEKKPKTQLQKLENIISIQNNSNTERKVMMNDQQLIDNPQQMGSL